MISKAKRELGARMIREYEAREKAALERIARMSPAEQAELQEAADNLGRKMESGFDYTFKNVTPPSPPKAKGQRRPKRAAEAGHAQMPEQKPAKSQV
ncbi:MAG: hypothetical protein ABSE73_05660 [Planctomycetota bacterium]